MKNIIKLLLKQYFLPRWIVLVYDLFIVGCVFTFSTYLVVDFSPGKVELQNTIRQAAAVVFLFFIVYLFIKPHYNVIRHTTIKDFFSIVYAHILGTSALFGLSVIGRNEIVFANFIISYSTILIQFFISVFILLTSRLIIKAIYHSLFLNTNSTQNIMIFGTGKFGMLAHEILEKENQLCYNVAGFIDDNPKLHGKRINSIRVYSEYEAINHIFTKKKVKEIIIATGSREISRERKQKFVNSCLEKGVQIKEVSDVSSWIKGSVEKIKIQNIKIEDLLGREPISIDTNKISEGLNGKRIMVTGAAGSIGSEIVRKLLSFNPANVILVDQSESAIYNLNNELLATFGKINVEIVVGNVSDQNRMRSIFENCRPEIVFHAAAYKHVPLMEEHPYEAVKTNIGGTKVIADLSVEFEVTKFVMISTDKAVNPTNVMGASKRICEIYTQSLSQLKGMKTQFVTTRFGNVLGSNGSVVPLFKSQIDKGGPVTITHKDITRYFMTIPEACQLVLEAGFMGNGSEIYVFDMGSPIKIYDLAEKMISLSGYIPHKDIKILETGLRAGEKLYEEVLSS
ncbi:MAG TPA: nucleoside-diphosphate sugar epimerase/dehydratase, partial [Prolixibacteraceae bacterium]